MNIIIAIDGPAASGKSTSAKLVAKKLGYLYIDTGAMYRAVTLEWLRTNTELNETNVCNILKNIKITLKQSDLGQITLLNGEDVSEDIRSPEVTASVSQISAFSCVRGKLVSQQQMLGQNGAVVMDGRDIGTAVFPNAHLKVFLIASIEARAMRRKLEYEIKGINIDLKEIKQQIVERDIFDSSREISPLKKAEDAIEIDTSYLTISEQTNLIVDLAIERIHRSDNE